MEVARADPRKASRANAHRPSARCTDAKRQGREKRQRRSPDAPVFGAYFTPPVGIGWGLNARGERWDNPLGWR